MIDLFNNFMKSILFISGNEISDYHEIIPNLYVGNSIAAKDYCKNFDIIINATPSVPFYSKISKNIRISVKDDRTQHSNLKLAIETEKLLPYLHTYLKHNKKVLVHCRAGMQRSASIVAAYLIRYKKYSINDAKEIIKSKRNIAFMPLTNFPLTLEIIHHNTYNKNKYMI